MVAGAAAAPLAFLLSRRREGTEMAGPYWLAAAFAAVMIVTAAYCAGRLAVSRRWRRPTELDADALHLVMGVAMAGMLLPQLSPLPDGVWVAVFGVAAAWFAGRAVGGLGGFGRAAASRWRSAQPVPHLVESAAMIYMFAALPGSGLAAAMPMPGMGHAGPGGSLLALAVVLALFMVGYVLWTADQLTSLARASAAPGAAVPDRAAQLAGSPVLAPALAACAKIAMGVTMGYMLVVTL
jgi:Domain of unknown function (DUF5134)